MGDVITEMQPPAPTTDGSVPLVEQLTVSNSAAAIVEASNQIVVPSQSDNVLSPTPELVKPKANDRDEGEALTDISADDESPENDSGGTMAKEQQAATESTITTTKKSKSGYKYDPEKITLRFLFANRDGLAVNVECKPSDTVGEVKGALLSMWPEGKACTIHRSRVNVRDSHNVKDSHNVFSYNQIVFDFSCFSYTDFTVKASELGGDSLRLICMGKGFLMPDTRTLEECQVPVFKTHPTPINVSIKPQGADGSGDNNANNKKNKTGDSSSATAATGGGPGSGATSGIGSGTVTDVARQGCCVIQ
jgi:Ubiquitin-2 like Rad60 SUMO-like